MAPILLTPEQITQILCDCRLECDIALLARVQTYLQFLAKWNARINLTGIRRPADVLKILFAESFFGAVLVGDPQGAILDVGSGAGFPGLAMAMYRPELKVILLEPRKKRAAFLAALRRELGLAGVSVWNRRLQECVVADFSDLPTVLTMRAVGQISEVIEHGAPLLRGDRRVLLFSSVQAAKPAIQDTKGVCWQPAVPFPWDPAHLILLGRAMANVPRGTSHLFS